jgi:hypothetical protein
MGEAKRRRLAISNGACLCGSTIAAKSCCWQNNRWSKPPIDLHLRDLPEDGAMEKCYLKSLGSCDGKLSREHLISRSVLEFLYGTAGLQISGLPWIERGQSREVPLDALTTKCLCRKHNSALAPLDTAALQFFQSIHNFIMDDKANQSFLVCGHDIERWLLKTTIAMAVSGNFGDENVPWRGDFISGLDYVKLLDEPKSWAVGTGLYFTVRVDDVLNMRKHFQIAPHFNKENQIVGIEANLYGIDVVLNLAPRNVSQQEHLRGAAFRMEKIKFVSKGATRDFHISWFGQDKAPSNSEGMSQIHSIGA